MAGIVVRAIVNLFSFNVIKMFKMTKKYSKILINSVISY